MGALPHRTQCPDPESQSALGRGVLPRAQNWKDDPSACGGNSASRRWPVAAEPVHAILGSGSRGPPQQVICNRV